MSVQLSMFDPPTSEGSPNATSSPASGRGATHCAKPGGPTTAPCGPGALLASPSRLRERVTVAVTRDTSPLFGSNSSKSAALQSSLVSKLKQRLGTAGGTIFTQDWRLKTTPAGWSYWAHTARGHRTSDSGSSSWGTPSARDWKDGACREQLEQGTVTERGLLGRQVAGLAS